MTTGKAKVTRARRLAEQARIIRPLLRFLPSPGSLEEEGAASSEQGNIASLRPTGLPVETQTPLADSPSGGLLDGALVWVRELLANVAEASPFDFRVAISGRPLTAASHAHDLKRLLVGPSHEIVGLVLGWNDHAFSLEVTSEPALSRDILLAIIRLNDSKIVFGCLLLSGTRRASFSFAPESRGFSPLSESWMVRQVLLGR